MLDVTELLLVSVVYEALNTLFIWLSNQINVSLWVALTGGRSSNLAVNAGNWLDISGSLNLLGRLHLEFLFELSHLLRSPLLVCLTLDLFGGKSLRISIDRHLVRLSELNVVLHGVGKLLMHPIELLLTFLGNLSIPGQNT